MTIGIYRIYNVENGNSYIGQSKNIEYRWEQHKEDLKVGKHHQYYLQKEYDKNKKVITKQFKDNELSNYLDYDKITIDKYYKLEILKQFNYHNLNELLELEDQYILKYRDIQEGYKQKTNKEIDGDDTLKGIHKLIEEDKKERPHYWEFMTDKFNRDSLIYEKLQKDYLNGKITLNQLQKEIVKMTKLHHKEYINLHGNI